MSMQVPSGPALQHCSKNEHIVLLSIIFFTIVLFLLKLSFFEKATQFDEFDEFRQICLEKTLLNK